MKKLLLFFVCLLTTTLAVAQKPNYNIGVLLDQRTEKVEPIFALLQEQIRAVVGEDATISFPAESVLVNNFDLDLARQNYNQLLNDQTDIILAFGVVNNQVVGTQPSYPKPTILFGAVNQDFETIDLSKATSGIENFTYLIESRSYLEDFKTFKELTGFTNLGIIIEQPLTDMLPLADIFDGQLSELDADYRLIPFQTVSDITDDLEGIDAVYMAGGFFLNDEEISELANEFIEKGLPSFTSLNIEAVQLGLMATNQAEDNFNQFLRRIALTVEGYVNDTPLAEMPVYIDYSPRLTVNYSTALLVDVPIKYSLITNTNFVGEPNNVLSTKTYNVLEVIDGVLEQNLSLRSQLKDVELAQQDVKTAKSNYYPSVSAAATGTYVDPDAAAASNGQNPEFSTAGNITLQQTIFSEAANANISIQKKLQKAQQENFNAVALDAVFDASNAYFNVLILKANLQIQLRNLEVTKQNLKIAQQNFEAGEAGKSDVLRFTSQQAQDTQSLVEAINQLEQGYLILKQLLNIPLDTEIEITDAEISKGVFENYNYDQLVDLLDSPRSREPFIEFLVEEAKRNAPELKSLQYNLEAVERNIRLNTAGRFLPTVALQGQYNRTFNRSGAGSVAPMGFTLIDDSYNVGVNVSIPILNQFQTNINRQTNIIQQDQLNINKENTELALNTNVRSGVLNVINQISNIDLSIVAEEAAKEALDLTQTSYTSGAVSIIQLIDAQNNYLNAQLASANAVYNFLINSLQLERSIGYYFLLNSEEENAKFTQRFLEFLNNRN